MSHACGSGPDQSCRAEFYGVARDKGLTGAPGILDTIYAIAAMALFFGVVGVQDDVAVLRATQGVGFDSARLVLVEKIHTQAVGGSKADNFQIRPGDPRYRQRQGTLAQDRLSGGDLVGGGDFRRF